RQGVRGVLKEVRNDGRASPLLRGHAAVDPHARTKHGRRKSVMSHDKSKSITHKSITTRRAEMGQSKYQSDCVRRRYANDPEFRGRVLRANLNSYIKKKHGITLDQYEAQRAAQQGLCACCGKKLSSVRHVHHTADGKFGLLCVGCSKIVASV